MRGSRPLTLEEIQACIKQLSDGRYSLRNQAFFVLGCNTGFRVSELLSIKVKDVMPYDKISDTVTVEKKNMKKKQEGRTVQLNDVVKRYLKNYIDNFHIMYRKPIQKDFYLFKSQKTDNKAITPQQATYILSCAFRALQMDGKLGTHCMRKSYAKNMHQLLDGDILKTQLALGHKEITSTQHYLSFDKQEVSNAIKKLNLG